MNPGRWPRVSVVIPCRNEIRAIRACLDSVLTGTYPPQQLEVLVADGLSDDGTRDVVAEYAARDPRIRLLDNHGRTAPAGLNTCIRAASGEVIVRMDAHATYPDDYISRLVEAMEETGAENVGTLVLTEAAEDTAMARAIALGLSHPLGVGNSRFRIGARDRSYVDHVPFGCWRRTVLDRLGPFDEELTRGQDVEMNARILAAGGRILLLPDVVSRYHARRTLGQLGRMMYQYGYFKPLIARKSGRLLTVRQLVPPGFLLALLGALLLAPVNALPLGWLLVSYAALLLGGVLTAAPRHGWPVAIRLLLVLPTMHTGYGVGYLLGVLHHLVRSGRRTRPDAAVALTR